jgi:hypothetical protein
MTILSIEMRYGKRTQRKGNSGIFLYLPLKSKQMNGVL